MSAILRELKMDRILPTLSVSSAGVAVGCKDLYSLNRATAWVIATVHVVAAMCTWFRYWDDDDTIHAIWGFRGHTVGFYRDFRGDLEGF